MFSERIFVDSNKNIPKATIMVPPTKLRLSVNSPAVFDNTLLIKTPRVENTTENPSTKNIVFNTMFNLLIESTEVPFLEPSSVTVVPDMYARKAGIIGSMQGAMNELRPASNATSIVGSAMTQILDFPFKTFFHFFTQSLRNQFLTGMKSFLV